MNTQTNTTTEMPDIPANLRREKNAKGITLSGGIADKVVEQTPTTKQVTVKAAKLTAPKAAKPVKAAAAPKAAKPVKQPKVAKTVAVPVIDPATGLPIEKVVRSIVPMRFKQRYAKTGGTCGDDMALELKAATTTRNEDKREALDVKALWAIAKANKLDVSKYVDLNNGQKRMNVGNKLRGKLAAGEDVVIGTRTFKAEDFTPRH